MASAEQPFDERELRYFLAEILKVSSIPPYDLFHLIQARGISPDWTGIALPNGRSVSACTKAYSLFQNPPTTTFAHYQPQQPLGPYEQATPASKLKKKRQLPTEGSSMNPEGSPVIADRTLQPQQSTFPSVNVPSDPVTYQGPPGVTTGEPPRKKRGRPNKEEFEKRVAEAAQRGEVYPQPRKRKTPRPSTESALSDVMATPATSEAGPVDKGEGSTGKKKATKAKATPAEIKPPLEVTQMVLASEASERNSALKATANVVDRIQIDNEEAVPSMIPETQASSFPARESLLAGTREHAALTEPDTVQSSYTFKEESAPRSELATYSATPNPLPKPATTSE